MLQSTLYNQHRIETHRALELLGDYYAKLTKTHEKQLTLEIERLIRVLKSRFFQALIDIQEFYEISLLDIIRTNNIISTNNSISLKTWNNYNKDISFSSSFSSPDTNLCSNNKGKWKYGDICIIRGGTGLGFSIAGGTDNPHLPNDFYIYITKIIPHGAAAVDGRLQINDRIEKVNDVSVVNVTHATAVDILKKSGDKVKLYIRREITDNDINEIELIKGEKGLGFSIAGGIGNQHIPGENGIYITKIMDQGAADIDGRLKIGHKLVAIRNASGDQNLENVTHEEAVEALKNVQNKIILFTIEPKNLDKYLIDIKNKSTLNDSPDMFNNHNIKNLSESIVDNPSSDITSQSTAHEIDNSMKKQSETVTLNKGPYGLGFNIIGGDDGEGIFISFILKDGPADINGHLYKGDKIKSVNGINFLNISHEEAACILKGTGEIVTLIVQHNMDEYEKFEKKLHYLKECQIQQSLNGGSLIKTTQKKSMFVRALFDYDPNKDDGLPSHGLTFQFGDILHVTNASDDEWWLATKVYSENNEGFGIIPARKRWERKQRARDRSVKFEGHMSVLLDKQNVLDKRKKNYSFSRKFPFMKNKDEKFDDYSQQEQSYMLCYTQDDAKIEDNGSKEILYRVELPYMEELTLVYLEKDDDEETNQQLCSEDNILTYDKVKKIKINYTRPVIILGPMKDRINDDLITQFPEKFGSCIPHTTRPKKDTEIDGRDYYFIVSREDMERDIQNHFFIEAGQYNENLYGTSIASVREVAEKGKHCILDVSGNAIKRLYAAHLYPIALFIKVPSLESVMNINKKITEDQAKKIYYRSLRIEQEFAEHFTGIIEGQTYQDIYTKIKQSISKHSDQYIWVSCKFSNV
ncbi:PREDICTED: disks large 1 tumor suppressor protein-like [Ceratosolen solmsi marchali]|uniref:Disks large 1 tumor suppressor protein-like n=1 Tax=Ceratosolen solmsi marchali TaxID=326594 RepID=A0AAJ7E2U5_9HYME|nr:PREDICTED: disks large 1 tumor suppressor protein-like [Ceratosolen solmsi marchali]